MDLVIFTTPEVFFSEVINGRCPFIWGFNFRLFFFLIVYKVLWELILSELMKIRITGSFGGSELRRKVLMISWAVKSAINKMKQ